MTKFKTALVVLALLATTSVAWAQTRNCSCITINGYTTCQCY
jgi:hypothetical protein